MDEIKELETITEHSSRSCVEVTKERLINKSSGRDKGMDMIRKYGYKKKWKKEEKED